MAKLGFHESRSDEATRTKLEIFRRYVREWVSTLLTQSQRDRQFEQLNLYDFFAGPGRGADGVPGSPLIMIEEIASYCRSRDTLRAPIPVRLVFNDKEPAHIKALRTEVEQIRCLGSCCSVDYSSAPFHQALPVHLPHMRKRGQANLVLMDQFGVGDVTPNVVQDLLDCGATDALFFISSSFIYRFIDTPEIQSKLDVDPEEVKRSPYKAIHRYICDHFQEALPDPRYLLAPFSLKKGSNIYGVIFAATHRLAMEKFLSVCWKLDPATGQANYNVDGDPFWEANQPLLPGMNVITRVTLFERALMDYIQNQSPSNVQLYGFCLEQGFCSSKAGESLLRLQNEGILSVWDLTTQGPARRRSFYLTEKKVRVRFGVQGDAPEQD
jgi:three-Cys-motif partner protein